MAIEFAQLQVYNFKLEKWTFFKIIVREFLKISGKLRCVGVTVVSIHTNMKMLQNLIFLSLKTALWLHHRGVNVLWYQIFCCNFMRNVKCNIFQQSYQERSFWKFLATYLYCESQFVIASQRYNCSLISNTPLWFHAECEAQYSSLLPDLELAKM